MMSEADLPKILVLSDCRRFGDALYEGMSSFIQGLVEGRHEVLRYDFQGKKIKPCVSCFACNAKEVPCSYLDDFNMLGEEMLKADAIAFFAEGFFSPQFLAALSKFIVFSAPPKNPPHIGKAYLFYVGSEEDERQNLPSWIYALLNLGPLKVKAVRFPAIGTAEKRELAALGEAF
jgi:multimeric flavodoxin WrbA